MRIVVVAVGKLRPPFADDVAHYQKLLAGHARLELIEVRDDAAVPRRLPERAFVSLLDAGGQSMDSPAFARWVQARRIDAATCASSSPARSAAWSWSGPSTGCRWAR